MTRIHVCGPALFQLENYGDWRVAFDRLQSYVRLLECGPVMRRDREPARLYDSRTRSKVRTSRYLVPDGFAGCVLSILALAPFIVLLN